MRACSDATPDTHRYGTKCVGVTTTPRRQRRATRTKQSTYPTSTDLPTQSERTKCCGIRVLQALGAQGAPRRDNSTKRRLREIRSHPDARKRGKGSARLSSESSVGDTRAHLAEN